MKFLVQKINNEVVHDFSFTLIEAIRYRNWYNNSNEDEIIYTNDIKPCFIEDVVPIGSVEFVSYYLKTYFNKQPKPINVPEELYLFADRRIVVGNEDSYITEQCFAKSHDKIKRFADIIDVDCKLDPGEYQFSDIINIDSEWRCFVFENKLVGLQNYSGDFTKFPNLITIEQMIQTYSKVAPVSYTLDIGINHLNDNRINNTFVIEVHDLFSCGLYGFSDLKLLPLMFYRWFNEFIKK